MQRNSTSFRRTILHHKRLMPRLQVIKAYWQKCMPALPLPVTRALPASQILAAAWMKRLQAICAALIMVVVLLAGLGAPAARAQGADDLDAMLMRLAQAPLPASLDGIEARVLARITARPAVRAGMGVGAVTIAAALVMGMVGAGVPAKEARAASLSPLGPVSPLAPSTLLVGAP